MPAERLSKLKQRAFDFNQEAFTAAVEKIRNSLTGAKMFELSLISVSLNSSTSTAAYVNSCGALPTASGCPPGPSCAFAGAGGTGGPCRLLTMKSW